jgi:hypothetical protein
MRHLAVLNTYGTPVLLPCWAWHGRSIAGCQSCIHLRHVQEALTLRLVALTLLAMKALL